MRKILSSIVLAIFITTNITAQKNAKQQDFVPDELIIKLTKGSTDEEILEANDLELKGYQFLKPDHALFKLFSEYTFKKVVPKFKTPSSIFHL